MDIIIPRDTCPSDGADPGCLRILPFPLHPSQTIRIDTSIPCDKFPAVCADPGCLSILPFPLNPSQTIMEDIKISHVTFPTDSFDPGGIFCLFFLNQSQIIRVDISILRDTCLQFALILVVCKSFFLPPMFPKQ